MPGWRVAYLEVFVLGELKEKSRRVSSSVLMIPLLKAIASNMRICYVCHQFFPDCYTGTERYTLELAKQLQRMGHQICILTYALKDLGSVTARSGVAHVEYDYEGIPVIALQHRDLGSRGGLIGISFDLGDSMIREEAERLLTERAFDIMHCVHPMRMGGVLEAAKKRGLKLVLTLMDYWMICPRVTLQRADGSLCKGPDQGRNCTTFCYQDNGTVERLFERYAHSIETLAMVDAVLSHSRFLIDIFKQSGIDTGRFIHCPNGFNYARVASVEKVWERAGTINFGFIGTILPHKGVEILVDAFKRVLSDRIRLKINGGSFGEHDYYSRLVAKAEGDKRIEFGGDYEFSNIGRVLEDIDVVVVPSLWYENAPLVIGAAQAFGIPVIATGLGGMKEMIVDGVNGFTFRLGDAEDLANKIRLIAANPGLVSDLSKNRMRPPRIESEAFLLETLYSGLIEKLSQ
jgi:glycosyltransferase involved in cell wall biosynthesis